MFTIDQNKPFCIPLSSSLVGGVSRFFTASFIADSILCIINKLEISFVRINGQWLGCAATVNHKGGSLEQEVGISFNEDALMEAAPEL